MFRNTVFGWLTLVLVAQTAASAIEKELSPTELYGQGIHAYFAGDLEQAIHSLTAAIDRSDQDPDPKPYFFRGLALSQQGGMEAAQADFAKGAALEAVNGTRSHDVSAALQRIQGTMRTEIERQRSAALKLASEKKKEANRARYEQLKRSERNVLVDPNRPAPKIDFPLLKMAKDDATDPFSTGLAFSGGEQVTEAVAESEMANPLGDANVRDPFAASAETMGTEKADTKPADPFATDDPFGDIAPASAPGTTLPKKAPRPVGDDPFGDMATGPAENAPDAGSDDLFDGKVNRPTIATQAVGSVLGVLGKTLSGQNSKDRDPFGDEPAPAAQGTPKPSSEAPAEDPFK